VTSSTPLALVREALTAKLNVDLRRPHAATAAAKRVAVLAARLDQELAGDRARGTDAEPGGDPDQDGDAELVDLLAERHPLGQDGEDDEEPGGPT